MSRQTIRIKREFSAGNPASSRKPPGDGERIAQAAAIVITTIIALTLLFAAVAAMHH